MCETAKPFEDKRETNIFLRIRKKMPSLSVSHGIIAELILNRCSEVVKMSSHDIARELKISPSTIVRFAVEIGYSGFREMMSDLQSTVFNYSQAPMQKLRDSIRENEPLETILQKVVEQGVENLALRKFTPLNDTFMKVVRFMIDAEKIYLIGAPLLLLRRAIRGILSQHYCEEHQLFFLQFGNAVRTTERTDGKRHCFCRLFPQIF